MKKLSACLIFLFTISGCAKFSTPQAPVKENVKVDYDNLEFQGVLEAPGLTREQIIKRVNRWAVNTYRSYKDVFQYSDESMIALNPIISIEQIPEKFYASKIGSSSRTYHYQFRLDAKDGKARLFLGGYRDSEYQTPVLTLRNETNMIENMDLNRSRKDVYIKNAQYENRQFVNESSRMLNAIQQVLKATPEEW